MSKNPANDVNQGMSLIIRNEFIYFCMKQFRVKEENEHLLRQLHDRTQQYENEKSTLLLDHQRRLDDLQRDRTTELENLRTLQRFVFVFNDSLVNFISLGKLSIIYDVNMNRLSND